MRAETPRTCRCPVECSAVFKIYRALFYCYGKYADSADPGGANWQVRAMNAVTGNGVQETVFPRDGPARNPTSQIPWYKGAGLNNLGKSIIAYRAFPVV